MTTESEQEDSDDELQELYDNLYNYKMDSGRKSKRSRKNQNKNMVPPPLITFAELYEKAQELAQQRQS